MPVTVRPRPEEEGINTDAFVTSSDELLARTSKAWVSARPSKAWIAASPGMTNKRQTPEDRPVLRTSFENLQKSHTTLIPYGNGFVDGIIRAFEQDLHLVLRPDDVWLAILIQFNFYVNANAEKLRDAFVTHKKKKLIEVDFRPIPLRELDFQQVSEECIRLMKPFLVDDSLSAWLLPAFSTTTANDKTVSALTMMSTMKSYFDYTMICGGCGFPSVTLEGEKQDWEDLAAKIQKLSNYGHEPTEWSEYLGKIAEKMIESFDRPDDESVKEFWMQACHSAGSMGSGIGIKTLSGWLTAFCYWTDKGEKIVDCSDEYLEAMNPHVDRKRLILDGVSFPVISRLSVPKAVIEVPIKLKDYDNFMAYETTVIAGFVGMKGIPPNQRYITKVQPMSGWWMLEDKVYSFQPE